MIDDLAHWRNRVAERAANWIINHIATPKYRQFLSGVYRYGLDATARDVHEGRPRPQHWKTYIEPSRSENVLFRDAADNLLTNMDHRYHPNPATERGSSHKEEQ